MGACGPYWQGSPAHLMTHAGGRDEPCTCVLHVDHLCNVSGCCHVAAADDQDPDECRTPGCYRLDGHWQRCAPDESRSGAGRPSRADAAHSSRARSAATLPATDPPHVEAWSDVPDCSRWGWQCFTCFDEAAAAWSSPDAALAQGDLHECGTPLAEVRP